MCVRAYARKLVGQPADALLFWGLCSSNGIQQRKSSKSSKRKRDKKDKKSKRSSKKSKKSKKEKKGKKKKKKEQKHKKKGASSSGPVKLSEVCTAAAAMFLAPAQGIAVAHLL